MKLEPRMLNACISRTRRNPNTILRRFTSCCWLSTRTNERRCSTVSRLLLSQLNTHSNTLQHFRARAYSSLQGGKTSPISPRRWDNSEFANI
ncbi:unnamed protein product [Hymenolepis diminuta]|uniref:Uncharacterized protein n=1 Tax=Hymenolepis diminuta TaxID=6216 RepID=A0A564Y6F1_HYMDI|nr:unnamed protein product [Hymenolepis diminuta]